MRNTLQRYEKFLKSQRILQKKLTEKLEIQEKVITLCSVKTSVWAIRYWGGSRDGIGEVAAMVLGRVPQWYWGGSRDGIGEVPQYKGARTLMVWRYSPSQITLLRSHNGATASLDIERQRHLSEDCPGGGAVLYISMMTYANGFSVG